MLLNKLFLYNHLRLIFRYEEITSKKLLGKRKRSDQLEIREDMMAAAAAATTSMSAPESEPGSASANKPPPEKRHKELQKRLDKMDKRGFLKPS